MTQRRLSFWLVALSTSLLAACAAPGTRVVLLPQPDGSHSAVIVTANGNGGAQILDHPYERATALMGAAGAPVVDQADPARVRADNKSLFDLAPLKEKRYTVYFDPAGVLLAPESQMAMAEALDAAKARSGGDIVVTGYTDTVGTVAQNDELSLRRAQQVRQMFIDRQFPAARIEAVGRGERELAVKTPDGVDEPRNRRVVIEVR